MNDAATRPANVSKETTVTLWLVILLLGTLGTYVAAEASYKTQVLLRLDLVENAVNDTKALVQSKGSGHLTVDAFNNYNAQLLQLNPELRQPPPPLQTQGK